MKKLILVLLLFPLLVFGTEKTRSALQTQINTTLSSGSGITAATLRTMFSDTIDSAAVILTDTNLYQPINVNLTSIAGLANTAGYLHNDGAGVFTYTNPSGSGTLTDFTAGTLSPLFTTGVANATSTPALSFTLSTHTANTVFAGPASGGAAVPTFRSMVAADLPNTAVTPGTYTLATVTFDAQGRATSASSGTAGAGTVTTVSVVTANGLSGSVANATTTPAITLTAQDAAADGATKGFSAFTAADFNASSGLISIDYTNGQAASGSTKGFLTAADWTTFNGKVSTGAATGSGLTMSTGKLLGRSTAATGAIEEITVGSGLSLSAGTLASTSSGGSVTTVSIVTANGVSGSVVNATTTPAITLALGAITPTSVASTGALSGTTLATSGVTTFSGGMVDGSASVLATSGAVNIDFSKRLSTQALVGATTWSFTGSPIANQWTNVVVSADSTARVVTLPANVFQPAAASATASFTVPLNTTLQIQLKFDGTNYVIVGVPPVTRGTGAGYALIDGTLVIASAKTFTVNNTITLAGTDSTTMTFPSTSATIARTDAANTFTGTQTVGALVATTVNKVTVTAPASSATLTVADGKTLTANQTTTLDRQASVGLPVEWGFAASDETTALTTGTKVSFHAPIGLTITSVRGELTTAQSAGSIFTFNVKKAGTSIFSTTPTIDNTETSTQTAATPAVLSTTSLSVDDVITITIDQIGTSGAAGLKVWILGYR